MTAAARQSGPPPRPDVRDPAVQARHMVLIRDDVRKQLHVDEKDLDDRLKELQAAMAYDDDGYKIGQNLEHKGWDIDAGIVETLESLSMQRYDARDEVVKEWVRSYDVKPALAIGAAVTIKQRWPKPVVLEGEITAIDTDLARYTVFIASEGHVRSGYGTHGNVVAFEEVTPVGATE